MGYYRLWTGGIGGKKNKMADVAAFGEVLIDFTCIGTNQDGYPTMDGHPGGAPANFLAAVTKAGVSGAMIGKVGNDSFGNRLVETISSIGIDTSGLIQTDEAFTTLAFVMLDKYGNREFAFARKPGADITIKFDEIDTGIVDACKAFHFGSLSLTDEPARCATYEIVDYAKKHGKIISYDPNYRPPLWNSETEAVQQMRWGLHQADIVKLSDNEARLLLDQDLYRAGRILIEDYNVKIAYITCGSEGVYYFSADNWGKIPCVKIDATDTTGAGDIFGGTALAMMLRKQANPDCISKKELEEIVNYACVAASMSTMTYGGIGSVPDPGEVRRVLNSKADLLIL